MTLSVGVDPPAKLARSSVSLRVHIDQTLLGSRVRSRCRKVIRQGCAELHPRDFDGLSLTKGGCAETFTAMGHTMNHESPVSAAMKFELVNQCPFPQ